MKILFVNKYHYYRAGAEKYYLDVSRELEKQGHEIAYFSMHHPKNLKTPWSKYFVSRLSFDNLSLKNIISLPARIIYFREAKNKFSKILTEFKPDIIHAHNIYHHISPSILDVAKKKNIPFLLHLHDYKIICPNYQIYSKGKIHWDYCGGRYYRCFFKKCFKNSYLKSFLVSLEFFIHHYILKIYKKNVRFYLSPSEYLKEVVCKFGVSKKQTKAIINYIEDYRLEKKISPKGDYWLYVGRLSEEKGVQILIKALKESADNSILKIAGDGPYKKELETLVEKLQLKKKVIFLGKVYGKDLKNLMAQSKALVMPSVWPENMPFVLLEVLALGKPVIASNIGGIPELIKHKVNGILFKASDEKDLSKALKDYDNYDYSKLANEALKTAEDLVLSKHLKKLTSIYNEALKK